MRLTAFLAVTVAIAAASASEPGQPLDCSDWVFLEPGHACVIDVHRPSFGWPSGEIDNTGALYQVRQTALPICPCSEFNRFRTSLNRMDGSNGGNGTVVAYIDDRCIPSGGMDRNNATSGLIFDRTNGTMLMPFASACSICLTGGSCPYSQTARVMKITGFATTFDVLQTFVPQSATLGFQVPVMPEGLAAADHFDTYWGALAHPIDFTQAHPLECDYPATTPHVGDYLSVSDTVPTPALGQGVYYVTAATHLGETRYGRKTTAGSLSGRDPEFLPACTP